MAIVGSRAVGKHVQAVSFMLSNFTAQIQLTQIDAGKSSMTVQFVDGHFVDSYYPTIENTFSKMIKWKNQDFATEIIDTAGQVREVFSYPRFQKSSTPHSNFGLCSVALRKQVRLLAHGSLRQRLTCERCRMSIAFLTRSTLSESMAT